MTIKGVLWHSTGANNATLKRYVQPSDKKPSADTYSKTKWLEIIGKNSYNNDMNHINREMGMNAWIGKLADGSVTAIQTMPWNYRPWGCASGKKGSCNDGWIQFEICEDGLTNKTYFNKIYKEACELTAYLCLIHDIDPKGTVTHNGVKVPTILCHQDSYKLGLGGNHSDIYHWFSKHGKDMTDVRNDVAKILKDAGVSSSTSSSTATSTTTVKTYKVVTPINKYSNAEDAASQKNAKSEKLAVGTYYIYTKYPNGVDGMYNISTDKTGASAGSWINPKENVLKESTSTDTTKLYRVRKSKDDSKSQKGAFSSLDNAKECCQEAGAGYHVFDWDYKIVYSYTAPAAKVTLSSIAITTKPTKTTYIVGESFDSKGLVVTATYSDKSTKKITDYKTSGFSSTKAGTVTVTVTYEDKKATFKVTITEKATVEEPVKDVAVYDLDYPEKTKIVDKSISRTNEDCVKAIKKILSNNKDFDVEIAKAFFKLAPKYGIDPMMAISQSILETGWFKYEGSAVTAAQHNYCGLGVTSTGVTGGVFNTVEDGVTAQLQHLFAYGCKEALPANEVILDPRFSLVTRGIATYWQQLAGRWACPGYDKKTYSTPADAMAAGNTYGQKILALYKTLMAVSVSTEEIEKYFPTKVETPVEPEVMEPENKEPEKVEPEVSEPTAPETEEPKTDVPEETVQPEVENEEQLEEKANGLAALIFKIIKKLVQMFANLFSKGE
jgi:flagellum-specific peptidoglycan hydrolase FlgJ